MARLAKGCPTPRLQQGGAEEPESNTNVPQQEKQQGTTEGTDIVEYNLYIDYKPEGSDPKL